MTQSQISIIVPVYNSEKYLDACIDSILSQSFRDFELILVDDGSKDSSAQICDEYASQDTRVRVIHKANGGVSAARNDGLDIAKGEYITFIDSDDWVEREYLETLSNYRDYDIVFFSHRVIYEDGYISEFLFEAKEGDKQNLWKIVADLKKNNTDWNFFGYTWNKMLRRDIIEKYKIRFIEGLRISEDEVYTLDYCTHAKSIKVFPLCLYNYRVLGNGLTATKNSADEYKKLAESYLAIMERETDNRIYEIYVPVVLEEFYTAAMNQDSPIYAFSNFKQMKNVLKKGHIDKSGSRKIKFVASMPIFLELIWWLCCRVKNCIVCFLKR